MRLQSQPQLTGVQRHSVRRATRVAVLRPDATFRHACTEGVQPEVKSGRGTRILPVALQTLGETLKPRS